MGARGESAKATVINIRSKRGDREEPPPMHEVRLRFDAKSFETIKGILEKSEEQSIIEMITRAIIIYGYLVELFNRDSSSEIGSIAKMNGEWPVIGRVKKALEITSWLKRKMREEGFDQLILRNEETGEAIGVDIDF